MLAVAAATGRIGYVFLRDGDLYDWAMSRAAGRDPEKAARLFARWYEALRPDVVVTERLDRSRKGARTRRVIGAVAAAAAERAVYDIAVHRPHNYPNKYDEAEVLAIRFPAIAPWLPKRPRIWEPEPRNMLYFEALALAVAVIDGTASERT